MKYWLHRISHENDISYPLLEKGYLSIGWRMFMHTDVINISRAETTNGFQSLMDAHSLGKSRSRWNLWYFAQFTPGDIVVVPLFDGLFSIYRVDEIAQPLCNVKEKIGTVVSKNNGIVKWGEDGALYRNNSVIPVDLGFVIKVSPLQEKLERSVYADNALFMRMKMFQTNGTVDDIADSIKQAIQKIPVSLYGPSIDPLANILREQIDKKLDDAKFERLIRWYFEKEGASVARIPAKNGAEKSGIADADIIAVFESLKTIYYVQAKKHWGTTNATAVEQIAAYKNQQDEAMKANKETRYDTIAWVITAADKFSEDAVEKAEEENVRLINGFDFAKALINLGIADIDSAIQK